VGKQPNFYSCCTRWNGEGYILGIGSGELSSVEALLTVPDVLCKGGTNLRVASVDLDGKKDFTLKQQKYKVSDALKTGEASDLFDYIAESVEHFITTHLFEFSKNEHPKDKLFLGFTFSFPVKQTALDSGTLITWTKGFTASNAKGKDVVVLLQTALDKRQIPVICSALVNDTVGTMLSRAYQSGGAVLGAIFGTGTNAAYLERYENVKTMTPDAKEVPQEYMIINTVGFFRFRCRFNS